MNGGSGIDRIVERSPFYTQRLARAVSFVPEPRATIRAEGTMPGPAAVGLARPASGRALRQAEIGGADEHGDAEGGGGLLAAFAAMADIDPHRRTGDLIANRTALTAAGERRFRTRRDHSGPPSVGALA